MGKPLVIWRNWFYLCIRRPNVSYSMCNCCGATTTANRRFFIFCVGYSSVGTRRWHCLPYRHENGNIFRTISRGTLVSWQLVSDCVVCSFSPVSFQSHFIRVLLQSLAVVKRCCLSSVCLSVWYMILSNNSPMLWLEVSTAMILVCVHIQWIWSWWRFLVDVMYVTYLQVQNATNANIKEKHETDLKKEIKKLQVSVNVCVDVK